MCKCPSVGGDVTLFDLTILVCSVSFSCFSLSLGEWSGDTVDLSRPLSPCGSRGRVSSMSLILGVSPSPSLRASFREWGGVLFGGGFSMVVPSIKLAGWSPGVLSSRLITPFVLSFAVY